MQYKACIFAALVAGSLLSAQETKPAAPAQPPAPKPAASKPAVAPVAVPEAQKAFVRRFSVGVTLSVLGQGTIPGKTTNTSTTTPAVTHDYSTLGSSKFSYRVGYGVTGQLAVTNHLAVSVGALTRLIGYQFDTTTTTGTTTTTTTKTHEDTRGRLYEVPVTLRYYTKNRLDPGPRVFFEVGGVQRMVTKIHSSHYTVNNAGEISCCTSEPATPAHRDARGIIGGFGVQLIDPIGIRVTPGVRYTRWTADHFDSFSTQTRRHQVEIMLTLGF